MEMDLPWYHRTTIYQIYPRSFYDTNADGIGDLQGIIQKLDYIRDLGFESIWISPFFASPQADLGYDISDYTDIAPEYGSMEDALALIEETHRRGMRIVFDMVMNHTSIEHPWFRESRASRDNPKADWYIWRLPAPLHLPPFSAFSKMGGARGVPNNWNSIPGGSGWHYAPEREQYYWASFLPFQPDLNYRNPDVKRAMFDVVRFWLEKCVDGFRLDIINVIYKDAQFRDNPFIFRLLQTENNYSGFLQEAKYNVNQPESLDFAHELRKVCDEFGEKILLGEATAKRAVVRKYLGEDKNERLGLMFNFEMLNFRFTADFFRELIKKIESTFPPPFMPVYVFSNHDRRRSIKRIGNDIRKARVLHMLQFTVRGVPCLYYGEEIGMTDLELPFGSALDPIPHKFKHIPRFVPDLLGLTINRDEVRSPMQWDTTAKAGFSRADKTWLPVHENYRQVNVEVQSKDTNSLLNTVRGLLKIRAEFACLREGSLELLANLPTSVLGYRRKLPGEDICVLLNFDTKSKVFPFHAAATIFRLTDADKSRDGSVELGAYGGLILKAIP